MYQIFLSSLLSLPCQRAREYSVTQSPRHTVTGACQESHCKHTLNVPQTKPPRIQWYQHQTGTPVAQREFPNFCLGKQCFHCKKDHTDPSTAWAEAERISEFEACLLYKVSSSTARALSPRKTTTTTTTMKQPTKQRNLAILEIWLENQGFCVSAVPSRSHSAGSVFQAHLKDVESGGLKTVFLVLKSILVGPPRQKQINAHTHIQKEKKNERQTDGRQKAKPKPQRGEFARNICEQAEFHFLNS